MTSFTAYESSKSLEGSPIQASCRNQYSPTVHVTCGARQLYEACTDPGHHHKPITALTLPDGRLNVGVHLPLLGRRYRYLSTLGEGVSAQVLLAEDTVRPGKLVTIKVMRRQHIYAGQREARALRFLHSQRPRGEPAPGVVRLLGAFMLGAHFCMVMERLYPRLLDWVVESVEMPKQLSLNAIRKFAHQLLVTVAFLHEHDVVHADIKPDNILMRSPPGTRSMGVHLIDFGGAYSTGETDMQNLVTEVQTLPYRAPEAALGCPTGAIIDEWSVGVVIAEVALKRPLFPATSAMELLQLMALELGPLSRDAVTSSLLGQQYDLSALVMPPPSSANVLGDKCTDVLPAETLETLLKSSCQANMSPANGYVAPVHRQLQQVDPLLADMVKHLLQYDPGKRAKAAESLNHPFFEKINPLRWLFVPSGGIASKGLKLDSPMSSYPTATAAEFRKPEAAKPDIFQQKDNSVSQEAIHSAPMESRRNYSGRNDDALQAASAVASGESPAAPLLLECRSNVPSLSGSPQLAFLNPCHPNERPSNGNPSISGEDQNGQKRQRRDRGGGKPWWMV